MESNTGSYFAQLQLLPLKERELFDLSRQQLIINDVYTFLLHKREETALSYASTVADSWVVNAPLSGAAPVSPNKVMIYFVGIALSIALAVLVVMGREVMNKKILFRTEIEAVTSVPVAAELLLVKGRQEHQIPTDRPSALAEQFRRLRVATGLYGKDAGAKKLMVSSSISGEGKSFVSLNLALSLALSGKKVFLLFSQGLARLFLVEVLVAVARAIPEFPVYQSARPDAVEHDGYIVQYPDSGGMVE